MIATITSLSEIHMTPILTLIINKVYLNKIKSKQWLITLFNNIRQMQIIKIIKFRIILKTRVHIQNKILYHYHMLQQKIFHWAHIIVGYLREILSKCRINILAVFNQLKNTLSE